MKKFLLAALAIAFAAFNFMVCAHAEELPTVEQYIDGLLSQSQAQCVNKGVLAKQYEAQGKMVEADAVRNNDKMMCDCMPANARKLKAILSEQERNTKITPGIFASKYQPVIINQCVAEQLKAPYAEGCTERFAKLKANSAKYCFCMLGQLNQISDADAVEIGQEASDYMPKLADAKKRGQPAPQQPPYFKKFMTIEASCAAQ